MTLYGQQLRSIENPSVLIFGATPELVDVAIEADANRIVCIEQNPDILEAMNRLSSRNWQQVEKVVGNWLEEDPRYICQFDYIACDGGLLFIEYPNHWNSLFDLSRIYLKPGGLFIAKVFLVTDCNKSYSSLTNDLIETFDNNFTENNAERIEAFKQLVSELRIATYIDASLDDGSFNQELLVTRADELHDTLTAKYKFDEMSFIVKAAMSLLARSRTNVTDTISGVVYEKTEKLLQEKEFSVSYHPLPDPPIPNSNYMFVAKKSDE